MKRIIIHRADLSNCSSAKGLVVSIDVLRAFTTAAYMFNAGVKEIILVSSVNEAFDLRNEMPDCLVSGEVNGIQVQGFDLSNSPSEILEKDLAGKRIIQRTTAGTQGVVLATKADTILTSAFCNLSATARYIEQLSPPKITLVQTGLFPSEGWGDEDVACADALEAKLLGHEVDWALMNQRVRASHSGHHYDGKNDAFPPIDLDLAMRIDCFDFAMLVERKNDLFVMHPLTC